jgi:tRNA pseudouridine55 synthase
MGSVLFSEDATKAKEEIIYVLNSFKGSYEQEVPIYSAVKINGKKLYEYAREGIDIELPKRKVEIKEIELLDDIEYKDNKTMFKFRCVVSKGTYIRSLINDIANRLDTIGIMTNLRRTRQGNFKIEDSVKLEDLTINNLKSIIDTLPYKKVEITDDIRKKVLNGALVDNIYNEDIVLFTLNNEAIALYKISNDKNKLKSYIMFKGGII